MSLPLFPRALVLFGLAIWISTETLGAFHILNRTSLLVWWIFAIAGMLLYILRHRRTISFAALQEYRDSVVILCGIGIVTILILTFLTAWFSPPNSADAMAYHMPRVVYWAEQSSVRFFPTPYFNQISLQPFVEYLMLHTYLLSGGDRFINLVQWFASLISIIAVACVAKQFGSTPRGQAVAALFCATLPAGILASSGAKNDYVMAMWLITAVYFALRFTSLMQITDSLFLGAALGFALFTKATAYLFAPWMLAAIFLMHPHKRWRRISIGAVITISIALTINAPQYVRNYELSGSIFGFDSAQGDGVYRWRNDVLGWHVTTSNLLRNLSDQLGLRSNAWNQRVYRTVLDIHQRLGIDPNDPETTWRYATFTPPTNANHEADAPNPWHLLILCLAIVMAVVRFRGNRLKAAYALAILCAFVAFCSYLKWQPFFARLLLPLFIAAAPLIGELDALIRKPIVNTLGLLALSLFLIDNTRHATLENWVRPLKGPRSVLHTPRDTQYFADMTPWNNRVAFEETVDILSHSQCNTIGIDITDFQLEYPLQAILRERNLRERKGAPRFLHTGVDNASSRYAPPISEQPCAVVCLDCAGDVRRLALYDRFPTSLVVGRLVIRLPLR